MSDAGWRGRVMARVLAVGAVVLASLLAGAAPATGATGGATDREASSPAIVQRPQAQVAAAPMAFNPGAVSITLHQTAGTFDRPVLITGARDGSRRLFVVEQSGRVKIIKSGVVNATPFMDLSGLVTRGAPGEQGLLGLAFHPSFRTNHKVYVDYTNLQGNTVIAEYRVSTTNANRVAASTARRILTIAQPFANHNGGGIAFGPDGFLYIGMGDGGGAGDPGNRAQSTNTLLGKMLRIDVNGRTSTRAYRIPSTNPYVGRTGLDEIWSRGLRNPWRWSFDRATGDLWIGDVGQGSWEEIDRSTAASGRGRNANYGWRGLEGTHCYNATTCTRSGRIMPVVEYDHGSGRCSITGGYVYRGSGFPVLTGGYFFGDYCSGTIWAINSAAASPATPVAMLSSGLNISSFGQDDSGELYVVDHSGGHIYRIWGAAR